MSPPVAPVEGEIHLWRFPLAPDAARAARLAAVLSDEERARAARLVLERDRDGFVIARATYRDVLGRYLGVAPGALPLTCRHGEKPRSPAFPYAHNLSHAHALGVVAVAAHGDLGVDVEYLGRSVDLEAVAQTALTPRERRAWQALPAVERRTGFFAVWTRKEAILKATGDRTAFEFNDMDADAITLPGAWSVAAFSPAPGYCGAIALRSTGGPQAAPLRLRLLDHDSHDGTA